MRAMVLAAGMGSRLRPLTFDRPKALVEVGGHTMLATTLVRLRNCGIREVVVNAHHHAEMIVDYLAEHDYFGLSVEVSVEQELLDTGGGLKKVAPFFLRDDEPILVHNVDVLSNVDFGAMLEQHQASGALATLAVMPRESSRQLLFDEDGWLCGRISARDGATEWSREVDDPTALAFCGLHILSPRIFEALSEEGAFSIIPAYLRLAAEPRTIGAFRADDSYWRDLGKPASIEAATRDLVAMPELSPFAET